MPLRPPLFILLVVIVSMVVVAALYVSGSPWKARMQKLDDRRASDLQHISYAIDSFWQTNKRLPQDLNELAMQTSQPYSSYYLPTVKDPDTGKTYEYKISAEASSSTVATYELCAIFSQGSGHLPDTRIKPAAPFETRFSYHGAGQTCFPLQVSTPAVRS